MEKGGAILLGFHVGPRTSWLALRILGFGVHAFIGHDYHRFRRPGLRAVLDSAETVRPAGMLPAWLHPQVLAVTDRLPRLAGGKADREACQSILRRTRGWSDPG